MKKCYIACALDCKIDFVPKKEDLIIGADRGYFTLVENGYAPQVAIGDFDSYTGKIDCENTIVYPVKKDFTDSALAIEYAVQKGYGNIVIFGGIGGALDHTVANIALVGKYAMDGVEIAFVDGNNVLFAVHNGKVCFSPEAQGRVSVFSFGDISVGVFEKGLLYNLENATLENKIPLGVSNEFVGTESEISVAEGTLLIYTSRKNFEKYLTR